MESEVDFFSQFAITQEEMSKSLEAVIDRSNFQKLICVCGHPMKGHSGSNNQSICSFANTYCRCQSPLAVIATSDLRYFKKLTRGSGADHALTLGCYSAKKAGKSVKWVAQPKCFKCQDSEVTIKPVAINLQNRIAFSSGEINVLLCHRCYEHLLFG